VRQGTIQVAVGRIRLDLPGCKSLKEKRSVIRPMVKRLRDRFGVSAAEVGLGDVWQSSVIAVAAVGGDAAELDSLLGGVMAFVRRSADAVVVDFGIEIIGVGEILPATGDGRGDVEGVSSIERAWLEEDK